MSYIKIENCEKCNELEIERVYTADSFENIVKWSCRIKNKVIKGYIDTFDKNPPIPEWCPLRLKREEK